MTAIPAATILARDPYVTPAGSGCVRYRLATNTGSGYAYVPNVVAAYAQTTLVVCSHGLAADYTYMENVAMSPNLHAMLDRGWIVATHDQGGPSQWGNGRAVAGAQEMYDWAARRWAITRTIAYGFSMGGLATLNIAGQKALPLLAGAITINGVVDTHAFTDQPGIWEAYGASSWDDLISRQSGSDPARDDPMRWAGLPILQVAGSSDSVCRPQDHAQRFAARAATPEKITTHIGSWRHLDPGAHDVIAAFMAGIAPGYDPAQAAPTHYPAPAWPDEPPPAPLPGTGVEAPPGAVTTDGTPVWLYTTDGRAVMFCPTS